MGRYQVTDDNGRSYILEGDGAPTEQELEEIFSSFERPQQQPQRPQFQTVESHVANLRAGMPEPQPMQLSDVLQYSPPVRAKDTIKTTQEPQPMPQFQSRPMTAHAGVADPTGGFISDVARGGIHGTRRFIGTGIAGVGVYGHTLASAITVPEAINSAVYEFNRDTIKSITGIDLPDAEPSTVSEPLARASRGLKEYGIDLVGRATDEELDAISRGGQFLGEWDNWTLDNTDKLAKALFITGAENAPMIITSLVPIAGELTMISSEAGQMYGDLRKSGVSENNATAFAAIYGIPSGIIETQMNRLIWGGMARTAAGKAVLNRVTGSTSNSLILGVAKPIINILGGAIGEGVEEMAQGELADILSAGSYAHESSLQRQNGNIQEAERFGELSIQAANDAGLDLSQFAKKRIMEGVVGALMGGLFGVGGAVHSGAVDARNAAEQQRAQDVRVDQMTRQGMVAEDNYGQMKEQYLDRMAQQAGTQIFAPPPPAPGQTRTDQAQAYQQENAYQQPAQQASAEQVRQSEEAMAQGQQPAEQSESVRLAETPEDATRQQELEDRVVALHEHRRSLRSEDGSVSDENIEEFRAMQQEINDAEGAADRGNNSNDIGIQAKGGDFLDGQEAVIAEKTINQMIESGIRNGKSVGEIVRRILSRYTFSTPETHLISRYVSDRMNNAPTVGNNKAEFGLWRRGQGASETTSQQQPTGQPTGQEAGQVAPITVESLMSELNLTQEQATATKVLVDQIWTEEEQAQQGIGGKPGEGALFQLSEIARRGFYSPVERAISGLQQESFEPSQLRGIVDKAPGVKKEELTDMGFYEWLDSVEGSVTKAQALEFIRNGGPSIEVIEKGGPTEDEITTFLEDEAGEGFTREQAREYLQDDAQDDTKFGSYVLPGGENYREVLITLPMQESADLAETAKQYNAFLSEMTEKYGFSTIAYAARTGKLSTEDTERYNQLDEEYHRRRGVVDTKEYKSTHHDEANVLAHLRINERTDENGNSVFFIEEVQSDWHQEGRKKGYGVLSADEKARYDALLAKDAWTKAETEEMNGLANRERSAVPNAPFKKSWAIHAFKQALKLAVEGGSDSIGWTPGEVQADRWGSELFSWSKTEDGWHLYGNEQEGGNVFEGMEADLLKKAVTDGVTVKSRDDVHGLVERVMNRQRSEWSGDNWTQHINKLTDRIWNQIEAGEDGTTMPRREGMIGFYDKKFKNEVQKYIRKLDKSAKVGVTKISSGDIDLSIDRQRGPSGIEYVVFDETDGSSFEEQTFRTKEDAEDFIENAYKTTEVWNVEITPQMREKVLAGQSLYQKGKGATTFQEDGKAIISALENPDVSTAIHELFHIARRTILNSALTEAQRGGITDAEIAFLEKWAGVKDGNWSVKAEEKAARYFERYMRSGKSPNAKLTAVFAKFKQWLTEIYTKLKGSDIDIRANKEIDAMLGKLVTRVDTMAQQQEAQTLEQEALKYDSVEAFVESQGTPLFHQTSKNTVGAIESGGFSLDHPLARQSDEQLPDGVFLKDTDSDISVGGVDGETAQVQVFVDLKNPLFVESRAHLTSIMNRDVEYAQLRIDVVETDRRIAREVDALEPELIKAGKDKNDTEYGRILDEQDKILDDGKIELNEKAALARARLTQLLKEQGYDGVVIKEDVGSFNRKVRTTVVLDPSAIKTTAQLTEIYNTAHAEAKQVPSTSEMAQDKAPRRKGIPKKRRTSKDTWEISIAGEQFTAVKTEDGTYNVNGQQTDITNQGRLVGAIRAGEFEGTTPSVEVQEDEDITRQKLLEAADSSADYIDASLPQMGLSIKDVSDIKVPKVGPSDVKSQFADVEKRWQASKGLGTRRILARIKKAFVKIKNQSTRHFEHINENESPELYDTLRVFEEVPEYSRAMAAKFLNAVVAPLNKTGKYDLFSRVLILRDLMGDVKKGLFDGDKSLPFGYASVEDLSSDLARFEQMALQDEEVSRAINIRNDFMRTLRKEMVKLGLLDKKVLKTDDYFHHQVMEFMALSDKNYTGVSTQDVRMKKKGWQKARVGSSLDFNTDYAEAEFEVVAQSLAQIETAKTLRNIRKMVDVTDEINKVAEATGADIDSLIPDGYVRWQPEKGNVFYPGLTMTEKALDNMLRSGKDITAADMKKALIFGGRKPSWIIPENIAKQLEDLGGSIDENVLGKFNRYSMGKWKQWTLINPSRIVKYNVNNMSGDLDITLAYDPRILKYAKQSFIELIENYKGKRMSRDIEEAMRYGVIGSGLSIQEIPDVKQTGALRSLLGNDNLIQKFWRMSQDFTNFRENLLRVAAYKYFKDKIDSGAIGVYGASNPTKVDAIQGTNQKAGLLARELIGDYGNVTVAGQWIRRHMIPFYSWMEVNAPRYIRMVRNIPHEGQGTAGQVGRISAIMGKKTAWTGTKLAVKMSLFYAVVNIWNMIFFPDEEKDLGPEQRRQMHLILGRTDDGSVRTMRIQGAFSDFLGWVGLEDAPSDFMDVFEGRSSVGDKLQDAAEAPAQKLVQGATPMFRTMYEVLAGKGLYPDIFNPRAIRDRKEHVARLFSLEKIYRWAVGRPSRGIGPEIASLLIYNVDPGEASYYAIRQRMFDFLDVRGVERVSGMPTRRSNALYYYRQALKYGDTGAAERYLGEYMELGGSQDGIGQSIRRGEPMNAIPKAYRQEFKDSMTVEEKELMRQADEWYRRTYRQR
ncbi:hypothetical protein N9104_01755 [Pseudomonadales bacterium]|nr:hypothetical protein [Pseudomonadales bacterium]